MATSLLPRITSEQIIVILVTAFIIFLILREVNTWYWKINARLSAQEKMARTLQRVENELVFITNYIKKRDPSAQANNSTEITRIKPQE